MKKIDYESPAIEVIELELEGAILQDSIVETDTPEVQEGESAW